MRESITQERARGSAYSRHVARRRIRRWIRLGARCILLTIVGLGLSIPLFDQHAVERAPWHEHLVFGGTAAQRARALEAHISGAVWPDRPAPDRPLARPARTGPGRQGEAGEGAVVISTPDGLSAASIGIGGPGLAAPDSFAACAAPPRGHPAPRVDALLFTEILLSIPAPPPRSAA